MEQNVYRPRAYYAAESIGVEKRAAYYEDPVS